MADGNYLTIPGLKITCSCGHTQEFYIGRARPWYAYIDGWETFMGIPVRCFVCVGKHSLGMVLNDAGLTKAQAMQVIKSYYGCDNEN